MDKKLKGTKKSLLQDQRMEYYKEDLLLNIEG